MVPRLHPDQPDESGLAEYIADMPGGEYVGEQWKDEELQLVAVSYGPYQVPHRVVELVMMARPGHAGPPTAHDSTGGNFVLRVGRTLVRLLEWHADDDTHETHTIDVPPWAGDEATYGAQLAKLWDLTTTLDEAEERLSAADDVAEEVDTPRATVLEVACTLWADAEHTEWEEALDKARAVLARTG